MKNEMSSKDGVSHPVRIGVGNALNLAPFTSLWKQSGQSTNWQLIEGRQEVLNEKLAAGELDIAFISSFAYGKNAQEYRLLPGLAMSASSAAGVAILFSHAPLDQLAESMVLLKPQVASSGTALARIILEEWNEVVPEYVFGDIMELQEDDDNEYEAVLATGDDALRLVEESSYLYQFDLGDIWKRKMELPFVFNVCAVRREFCDQFPDELARVYCALLRCRDEGVADLSSLSEEVADRIPVSTEGCRKYFSAIEYDFSGKKRTALEKFFQILIDRKELEKTALPLDFFVFNEDE